MAKRQKRTAKRTAKRTTTASVPPGLLTVPAVARELGVTQRTLWRWLKQHGAALRPIRNGPRLFLDAMAVDKLRYLRRGVPLAAAQKAEELNAWIGSRYGWDVMNEVQEAWRQPGTGAGLAVALFGKEDQRLSLVECYDRAVMILLEHYGFDEATRERIRWGVPMSGQASVLTVLPAALLQLVAGFEPVLVVTKDSLRLVPKPAVGGLSFLPAPIDLRLSPMLGAAHGGAPSKALVFVVIDIAPVLLALWKHWHETTPPSRSPNGYMDVPVPPPSLAYQFAPVVWDRHGESVSELDAKLQRDSYERNTLQLYVDASSIRLVPPDVANPRLTVERWLEGPERIDSARTTKTK